MAPPAAANAKETAPASGPMLKYDVCWICEETVFFARSEEYLAHLKACEKFQKQQLKDSARATQAEYKGKRPAMSKIPKACT